MRMHYSPGSIEGRLSSGWSNLRSFEYCPSNFFRLVFTALFSCINSSHLARKALLLLFSFSFSSSEIVSFLFKFLFVRNKNIQSYPYCIPRYCWNIVPVASIRAIVDPALLSFHIGTQWSTFGTPLSISDTFDQCTFGIASIKVCATVGLHKMANHFSAILLYILCPKTASKCN